MIRFGAMTALAICGLAAGLGAWPSSAFAWDSSNLPNGYSVTRIFLGTFDSNGLQCIDYTISGTHIGSTCDPGFQSAVDSYIDSTICTVNPAAGQQQGLCLPATTSTAAATTTTLPATTTLDTSPTATVPAGIGTTTTVTVTTTVTTADPTVDQRLTAIEQRQQADEARISTLETRSGVILGEPKNVAPFTNPT